jgi:hypothetical protein
VLQMQLPVIAGKGLGVDILVFDRQ